jgi:heptosyltransferase III
MMFASHKRLWVFHRGGLGDSVLTWPMLRARAAAGWQVTLVTDASKAVVAARELGIDAVDIEQRYFNDLWVEGSTVPIIGGVTRVASFLIDPDSLAGLTWLGNARRMFPGAVLECLGAPLDRTRAMQLAGHEDLTPARPNQHGPLIVHVGAGSRDKMWPLERWMMLAQRLSGSLAAPLMIAGEAEGERFTNDERQRFEHYGGRFIWSLVELADLLRTARLFIGADSGPAHLAAQLGIRTIALFGPTDPVLWAPIGPAVCIVAPPQPAPMSWLEPDEVLRAVSGSLDATA